MPEWIKYIYSRAQEMCADLLFPLKCIGCCKEGEIACGACVGHIEMKPILRCPLCKCETQEGRFCGACVGALHIDGVIAAFDYHEPLVAGLIKAWKYNYMGAAERAIGCLLSEWMKYAGWLKVFGRGAYLVPIPLHKRRFCERGFNQAALLARIWGYLLDAPVVDCLARPAYTEPQALQKGAQRQKLDDSIFMIKRWHTPPVRRVFLIDDVYTTGTTLDRAAHVLKDAGIKEIYGLVYARET